MTQILTIDSPTALSASAVQAAKVMREGGIVLYPTDTTYALGVNALNPGAVDNVFQLKGRDYTKPIHVIVRDMEQASKYVVVNQLAQLIAEHFLPGALTLVLPQKEMSEIPSLLVAGRQTLGIRIPDHPVCQMLSELADFPITTTSANRSSEPNTYAIETVQAQLGGDFEHIDLVLDTGSLKGGISTIVAVESDSVHLLREGSIPFSEITGVIQHSDERFNKDALYPGH